MPNRRTFLYSTAGALAAGMLPSTAPASNAHAPMTSNAALRSLMEGNARFAAGIPEPRAVISRVRELASGQTPFATVLACADSRVPVETLFDRDPGDIFVVRLAGNFVSDAALGSIEYATAELKSPLVLVLGHTSCGAVKAAMEAVGEQQHFPGQIERIAEAISPAARASRDQTGDWWRNAVIENVNLACRRLSTAAPIMSSAVQSREVEVVGGIYELKTGKVSLIRTS